MTIAYDVSRLTRWVEALTLRVGRENLVRKLETRQPALKPDGRQLRGIEVSPGLYLTRHGEFFELDWTNAHVSHRLDYGQVLARVPLETMQRELAAKAHARRIPLPNT